MVEPHQGQRGGDAARLVGVDGVWLAGLDVAEAAGAVQVSPRIMMVATPRAQHSPMLAAGLLADGVEAVLFEVLSEFVVLRAAGHLGAEPLGLALEGETAA